ncbi:NifB/NifX family molybdenum-iron cluster-binding protein [Halobacteriota archaeon]
MKVCLPTMNQGGMNDMVSPHFGRAPTFTIVDTETKEVDVLPNTSEHMGGIKLAPEIVSEAGVQIMICSGLGAKAIQMFEQFGIEVFVGAAGTVKDMIGAWKAGLLQEATDENACREHGH